MLTMAQANCISTLRQWKGKSISEISKTLGISWRTAKKYADGEELSETTRSRRERPKMGPFEEHLEAMILEDMHQPAKQRRTAKKMYEQLVELGYEGSDRTVRHWVKKKKRKLYSQREDRFVRLEHYPGHVQVDFQVSWVYRPYPYAHLEKIYCLVMSFPYSNATLSRALPAENAECLISALISMFIELGGVPQAILFDNLSPAVKAIKGYDRELTEMFERFCWHYRFEARFCNPGSPHEKGNVERKVSYVRKNALSPPPVVENLDQVNEILRQQADKDLQRKHYRKDVTMGELYEEDLAALLPLPNSHLEVHRTQVARANRVSEIRVAGDSYRIPQTYPGQRVVVQLGWSHLEVYDEDGEMIDRQPRAYAFDVEEVDWKAQLAFFVKKPRAVEQAVCLKVFPSVLRQFILSAELSRRRERVRTLICLFDRGFSLQEIKRIVELGEQYGRTDEQSLLVLAGYPGTHQTPLQDPHTPEAAKNWRPDMNHYALLTSRLSDHGE